MANEKRPVTVEIGGVRYRFTTDASEDHLRRLASSVDERLRKMGVRGGSPAQALAVVALGLAEDLEVAERRREELEERLDDTLQEAVAKIDHALAEEARHAETA